MICDCVKILKEKLCEKYDSDIETLNEEYKIFMEGGDFWPSLMFRYHTKKIDGTPSKKWTVSRVFPSYCPVCGKKYESENREGSVTINIRANIPERWKNHFLSMLKEMEYLGHVGSSRKVSIFSDGDGDFNPEFEFDCDYEKVDGTRDASDNVFYDAG